MKLLRPVTLAALAALILSHAAVASAGGWIALFDGKTLDGWKPEGGTATYKVENGAIVGTTTEGSKNTFLTKGPFDNFILEFDVLCDKELNSGVQIRSHVYEKDTPQASDPKRTREKGEVYGYQCEIVYQEKGTAGNFWDEGRWTRWHDEFKDPRAATAYKDGEWNHYRIVAQGDHIRSWVNGIPCADFTDDMDKSGFIGLQVHSIPKGTGPYHVRWRNIWLKEISAREYVK